MFEAFKKGDLDKLLETVHPDSRWTYVGANPRPAKGTYVGKDGVRKFFDRILHNLAITTYHSREFVTENDAVVVFGFESGTVRATGDPFRNEWAQKYVVQNGLITEMEEYNIQVGAPT
jgi:ketosteroid isomerase-like protein